MIIIIIIIMIIYTTSHSVSVFLSCTYCSWLHLSCRGSQRWCHTHCSHGYIWSHPSTGTHAPHTPPPHISPRDTQTHPGRKCWGEIKRKRRIGKIKCWRRCRNTHTHTRTHIYTKQIPNTNITSLYDGVQDLPIPTMELALPPITPSPNINTISLSWYLVGHGAKVASDKLV